MNQRLGRFFTALAMTSLLAVGCAHTARQDEESRTSGETMHDALTTASVKMALAVKPGVSATQINVDTDRGVVTLRGEVDTEAERQLAVMVAEDVDSVTDVENELTVRG